MPDLRLVALAAGAAVGLYLVFRPRRSSAPSQTLPKLVPGDRAGLVGDSLSVGLGAPLKVALAKKDVVLDAKGKGATIAGGWVVFPELDQVLAKKPRMVFVSIGTNDCAFDGRVCDAFEANIAQLSKKITDAGAVPIWLLPPAMPWEAKPDGAERMAMVRRVLQEAGGVAVITEEDVERAPDRIHMTGKGYGEWAEMLAEAFT